MWCWMFRKWMIVDENGSFRTQRQLPKMALIRLEIERDHFVFKSTDKGSIDVPFCPKSNNIRKCRQVSFWFASGVCNRLLSWLFLCRVWGTDIDGYLYGGDVAKWLSDVLETPNLDLVVFKSDLKARNVKQGDAKHCTANEQDQTIYADLSSFMLIGENSFESLNSKLDKKVTIRNFRPNFLVKGPEPFAEVNKNDCYFFFQTSVIYLNINLKLKNEWNSFSIDDAKFRKVRQCTRFVCCCCCFFAFI